MADLIGNAPPLGLLILIAIPLSIAIILGVFIAVSLRRRGRKSQMKLGITPKQPPGPEKPSKETALPRTPPPSTPAEPGLNLGLLNNFGNVKKEDNPVAETPFPNDSTPIDLTARLGQPAPPPPPASPKISSEPVELLRLLRHPESGQLIIEVAGQRYTKLADVTDKKIGQYILKLAAHFLAFTNGVLLTGAGMKSIPAPKVDEVPEPISAISVPGRVGPGAQAPAPVPMIAPSTGAGPTKAPPDVEATFLASLRGTSLSEPPPPPKPAGFFSRVTQTSPVSNLPGLNLAEEINEIVQARLRYSPLSNNRVEISSDHKGGIRILVNDKFYSSPDEVQNPEIKELIKASIKEWERK